MLFFLITCLFSYILFHHKSLWFWKSFSLFQLTNSARSRISSPTSSPYHTSRMFLRKKSLSSKVESIDDGVVLRNESSDMSVLDLPELVIESILEKLTPEGLCRMATVCSSLRDRCVSDHIWDKHMKNKWGRIIGVKAFREYKSHVASGKGLTFGGDQIEPKRIMGLMISTHIWPFVLIRSGFGNINKKKDCSQKDSVMAFYLALESGKFWFPAQVYNRENGHVGFMLSCYDAELSYDRHTDTFQARYPPHGRRASSIESGVTWDRIRASPVDTSPHDRHVSDCLNELKPGDQIEIQWRRNKEFPYGWWYGVVGHLETCDGNANYCRCRDNYELVLEFNQYTRGSRWRTTTVNRRDHREEGNEADGLFYGGIRMIRSDEEKSMWKKLWPNEILE